MRSSNPAMNSLTKGYSSQRGMGQAPNPYAMNDNPFQSPAAQTSARPMTVDDVVTKTGITLGVIIAVAVVNFLIAMSGNVGLAMVLALVGAVGAFVTTLVFAFGKKFGSAAVTLIYAAFEGLLVGGFSFIFADVSFGNTNGMALIGQAIMGTVGVFVGMLIVYKMGAVKVTPKFNKIMFGLIAGVAIMSLGNFLTAIFFGFNPLRDGGMIAIIFSLVCIVLAALSFMTDFDTADQLIRAGAPANYAWGVALGLAVTLVWLYTEILRLLSYFQER